MNNSLGNALVVAGGQWQVPIIEYLKSAGYSVSVVDPYDNSPGVLVADHHIKSEVRDLPAISAAIAGKSFELVTTDQSDISVKTVAELARKLSLQGNDPDVVLRFTNKFLSRQFARSIDVPVPKFEKVRNEEELAVAIKSIGLPVILKPVDSQSSRGIFLVDSGNVAIVEEFFRRTLSESREDYVLVEEFFEGVELTAEGICSGGNHRTLTFSSKKHMRTGIASDLLYPADVPPSVVQQIAESNDRYVLKSGLKFGITHAEYLWNKETGKICLVEIACRGGGSLISSDIVKWITGIDLYEILLKNLRGESADLSSLASLQRAALLHFFEFPSGVVKSIAGEDEVRKLPGVRLLQLGFKPGDRIKAAGDDRSRQGMIILFEESHQKLAALLRRAEELIKVEIETNE